MVETRQGFGLSWLDSRLGGGLRPGTLTLIAGATGAGKTQLGIQWAAEGARAERHRGAFFDLTSRGDSQNQAEYAERLLDWRMQSASLAPITPAQLFDTASPLGDIYRPFAQLGRRVTRPDVDPDAWHAWKTDLARVLHHGAAYVYGQLARGARRLVFDGLEPTERASDSIQLEYFEYLYEKLIHQEFDWAAREVLRENFRANQELVQSHPYDDRAVGCVVLYTTPQVMLEDLVAQTIGHGDLFATANTVIVMGRTRDSSGLGRALCVLKHRGSACDDAFIPYSITNKGLTPLGS